MKNIGFKAKYLEDLRMGIEERVAKIEGIHEQMNERLNHVKTEG